LFHCLGPKDTRQHLQPQLQRYIKSATAVVDVIDILQDVSSLMDLSTQVSLLVFEAPALATV
jgi:hypothetical protein